MACSSGLDHRLRIRFFQAGPPAASRNIECISAFQLCLVFCTGRQRGDIMVRIDALMIRVDHADRQAEHWIKLFVTTAIDTVYAAGRLILTAIKFRRAASISISLPDTNQRSGKARRVTLQKDDKPVNYPGVLTTAISHPAPDP